MSKRAAPHSAHGHCGDTATPRGDDADRPRSTHGGSTATPHRFSVARVGFAPSPPPPLVGGLVNRANSCFINAALQLLRAIEPLQAHFDHGGAYDKACATREESSRSVGGGGGGGAATLSAAYADVVREMRGGVVPNGGALFLATVRRTLPPLGDGRQHDAQEFLCRMLDTLREEQAAAPAPASANRPAPSNAAIGGLFRGRHRSTVQCSVCGTRSARDEHFSCLDLEIADARGAAAEDGDAHLRDVTVFLFGAVPHEAPMRIETAVDCRHTAEQACERFLLAVCDVDPATVACADHMHLAHVDGAHVVREFAPGHKLGDVAEHSTLCMYHMRGGGGGGGGGSDDNEPFYVCLLNDELSENGGATCAVPRLAGLPSHCSVAHVYERAAWCMDAVLTLRQHHLDTRGGRDLRAAADAAFDLVVVDRDGTPRDAQPLRRSAMAAAERAVDWRQYAPPCSPRTLYVSMRWRTTCGANIGLGYYMRLRRWLHGVLTPANFRPFDERAAIRQQARAAAAHRHAPEHTLPHLLSHYTREEPLRGDNRYRCAACGDALCDATKSIRIVDCPRYLLVALKRFATDEFGVARSKSHARVRYAFGEQRLDMTPFVAAAADDGPLHYRLCAVVRHLGASSNGGHYVAHCAAAAAAARRQWFDFDDENVRRVAPAQHAQSAYVLCYERVQP